MANIRYVRTREELKAALEDRPDYIVITDKALAKHVTRVKESSKVALTAAIVTTGVGATMWWNPLGWGAAAVAVTTTGTLVVAVAFLIFVLGAAILWALWKNWKIKARGKVTLPNGVEVEGEIILEPA